MALIDLVTKSQTQQVDPNKLTPPEIQLTLEILRQTMIRGEQVEVFYNLVVKLQNQFVEQTKK